jgi:hypothetical protein
MKEQLSREMFWFRLGSLLVLLAFCLLSGSTPLSTAQVAQGNRQLDRKTSNRAGERRVALVIGNGAYQNASRLANPVNDAADVAAALRELGFELVGGRAHVNQNADQMKRLIVDFGEMLSRGGVGLFYYAGHGVQSQGHNYLIPVEANLLKEKTLEFDAVDVNRVLAQMDAAGNGFNIVILDACRNSPFSRSWRDASQGLAQVNASEGTLIAYATSPGRVASDGVGRNGTYTAELLRQMRKPSVTVEEMFKAVRVGVKAATKDQQTPWESSSLVGVFCFAGGCGNSGAAKNTAGDANLSAVSRVDAPAFELSYWDSIKNSTDANDFKAYLEKYPSGQFVDLANNRIKSLEGSSKLEPKSSITSDATELAFWDSIKNSTNVEDFRAYLKKYPSGAFVDLANNRISSLEAASRSQPSSAPRTFSVHVRADSANNGWTNTHLVVRRGQRIRINASGRVSLGKNRFSTPDGLPNAPDRDKLMRDQPTGGLIAVVGDDNDDFIFVGSGREFVPQRDGVLFLGVNEGNLDDNSGSYDVAIEAEAVSNVNSPANTPRSGGQVINEQNSKFFKGTYGYGSWAGSSFDPVTLEVSAQKTQKIFFHNEPDDGRGYEATCAQFVEAHVMGSSIYDIRKPEDSKVKGLDKRRFNAESPSAAASALEAIRAVCIGK